MDKTLLTTLTERFGKRVTTSPLDRELYSRDLAPVPDVLVKPLFQAKADVIVRPRSSQEIAELMRLASSASMPVTPRAGGSTVFFNSVPTRGGMLIDLGLLAGVVDLDEANMLVTVRAGTTWEDLEKNLNVRGFACKSMPSSAPAATVGGWFAMMGYGIGSIKYGDLLSQIREAEVVMPDGEIRTVTADSTPPLSWFAASEGTLGIVTALKMEIRKDRPMKHVLMHIADSKQAVRIMQDLLAAPSPPYNLHFSDPHALAAMHALGYAPKPEHGLHLLVDYEGTETELREIDTHLATLRNTGQKHAGVSFAPAGEAEAEWQQRFSSLRLKRGGPSLLGGELWLPVKRLADYLANIETVARRHATPLMTYGHVVSATHATVMTMFYADERQRLHYILDLGLVKKIQDVGARLGGTCYGVGLWNTPYLKRLHPAAARKRLRRRKKEIDPLGLMNPGKLYAPPLALNPYTFHLGMEAALLARRVLRKKR